MEIAQLMAVDEFGIRLEMVNGLPLWEAHPGWQHQKSIDRIRASLRTPARKKSKTEGGCACIHASDVYIRFPDGSLKRPDFAIFCREPDPGEDEVITLIPEAVVEVVSKGYERKDLEIGPGFYLSHGVKDVVVFNPRTLEVHHIRHDQTLNYRSPVKLKLECGCICEV